MNAVRLRIVVPEDREVKITLPQEVPPGDVELILLVEEPRCYPSGAYALLNLVDDWRATHSLRRSKEEIDHDLEVERASWEGP